MFAEFYSLSEDKGVTFKAEKFDVCGVVWRLQLRKGGPFYWIQVSRGPDYHMCGRHWTDLGMVATRFKHFKLITQKEAKKWLIAQ